MENFRTFILLGILIFMFACEKQPQKPEQKDRNGSATLLVVDTSAVLDPDHLSKWTPVSGAKVELFSKEYNSRSAFVTDSAGQARIDNIIASQYDVNISFPVTADLNLLAETQLTITATTEKMDTILLSPQTPAPIIINEIYYCGPQNNIYFCFDQYVELYNRSDSTVYVDGMILARVRTMDNLAPNIDSLEYVQTVYPYQFPGMPGGTQYPVLPGHYVVVASDAFDHRQSTPNAVNLENADFEFYNEYKNDYDNPAVPNLVNLNPASGTDFLINLSSDAVVLSDGTNWELVTVMTASGEKEYVNLPLSTIIDGVEYKATATKPKNLTYRVDSGFTGTEIVKYSGKSVQRIAPTRDTNNSNSDFLTQNFSTPGY